jgi:hypothetical protein
VHASVDEKYFGSEIGVPYAQEEEIVCLVQLDVVVPEIANERLDLLFQLSLF